jgi:hypothetical protein
VFKIPFSVLITAASVPDDDALVVLDDETRRCHRHSARDVMALAWHLARRPGEIRPYLDSLPDYSAERMLLPVQWSAETLTRLLRGSPVLDRIRSDRKGLEADYELAVAASSSRKMDETPPSFAKFQAAFTAVKSRAFEGLAGFERYGGKPGDATLIPLLDLCDHCRGRGGPRKNLNYAFRDGCVVVRAASTIRAGDSLRITYGALGNSQLLVNYGFCIEDNLEPDGSSNDVLEFSPDGKTTVQLRTGPRSYTYGPFVKALECLYPTASPPVAVAEASPRDQKDEEEAPPVDDVEAFLNECEQQEEGDRGFDWDAETAAVGDTGLDEGNVEPELDALAALRTKLIEVAKGYECHEERLRNNKARPTIEHKSPEYYTAILLRSELRTLQFYVQAVDAITSKLLSAKRPAPEDKSPFACLADPLESNDVSLIEKQVEELATAYMRIRHSSL